MPYAADLNGERVYSLQMSTKEFDDLRGQDLSCDGCDIPMRRRFSPAPNRTPHFYHKERNPNCPTENMSTEHLAVQALVLAAIDRTEVWDGYPEYSGDGWRGDVVAVHRDNASMVSFEVQFSSMTEEEMSDRTARHKLSGVDLVIWLCGRDFAWMDKVPSGRLDIGEKWKPADDINVACKMLPTANETGGETYSIASVPLERFVGSILAKKVLARHEEKVAVRWGDTTDVRSCNAWLFETRQQVMEDTNGKAVAAIEAAERRERRREDFEANKRAKILENYILMKQELTELITAAHPDIVFDEGSSPVGHGATASIDGKLIVAQPVLWRVDEYWTPTLFDEATIVVFRHAKQRNKIEAKFPGRLNVYCWNDLVELGNARKFATETEALMRKINEP